MNLLYGYMVSTTLLLCLVIYMFTQKSFDDEELNFPLIVLFLACIIASPLTWSAIVCVLVYEQVVHNKRLKVTMIMGKYNIIVSRKRDGKHEVNADCIKEVQNMNTKELTFLLSISEEIQPIPEALKKAIVDALLDRKIFQ